MTTRLEYILEFTRETSPWLLTSNPSLNYILVKDSGVPNYPTIETQALVKPFRKLSMSSFSAECDQCFSKAYKDYEAELKRLNTDWDDSNELMNVGLDVCFFDFLKNLGDDLFMLFLMHLLNKVKLAFPKGNPIAGKLNDLIAQFKKAWGINTKPGLRGFDTQTHLGGWVTKGGKTAGDAPKRWWREAAAQKEEDWLMKGGLGPEPTPPIPYSLEKSFRDVVREIRGQFTTPDAWINFLKGLLSGLLDFAIEVGMACLLLDQIADIAQDFNNVFSCMNKECQDNAERIRNNLAAKYAAADKYFRDLADCQHQGCCDQEINCKGVGGWCTRLRNGPDFSYYIPCCAACGCDGDSDCIRAECTMCDPSSPCLNQTDDTSNTQTGSGTQALPTYLLPQSSSLQQACPPLPPGWNRLPGGDPDPRSSSEWDPAGPPPCLLDELKSAYENSIGVITNYWGDVCKRAVGME
jgi:hypothetical protein